MNHCTNIVDGVSFDKAAVRYDASRSLPPVVEQEFLNQLEKSFHGRPPEVLDVGAGTGRIAIPLAERGIKMQCVDIAQAMIDELMRKAAGLPIQCSLADATNLPFGDQRFDGVILCAVLHFIDNWRAAVRESCRVTRRGGAVMIMLGREFQQDTPSRELLHELRRYSSLPPTAMPQMDEIRPVIQSQGFSYKAFPAISMTLQERPVDALADIAGDAYPHTWNIPAGDRGRAIQHLENWARARWKDLNEFVTGKASWQWHRFRRE